MIEVLFAHPHYECIPSTEGLFAVPYVRSYGCREDDFYFINLKLHIMYLPVCVELLMFFLSGVGTLCTCM